ncbi:MAG TPA: TylF/MycF family methyltransferase [Casimicrobiaceae bacterium]|nr:TylF/MycF family methyltransferase [Casimicrobiaceae bacterium]
MSDPGIHDLRERYLDLVRDSLVGLVHEDPSLEERVAGGERPFDRARREEGRDWPSRALSMIGARRMLQLQRAAEFVIERGIPGDFVETGVWRGGACILMRAVLAAHGVTDRRVWVADSFAGLPEPDAARYPKDAGNQLHACPQLAVSADQVRENFRRYRLLDDQVAFLEGWFRDTLPSAPIGRLAILRLDGDLYESTMDALTALYDKVVPGGIVIVDDYGILESCRAAVEDFRRERGVTETVYAIDDSGVHWQKRVPG